MDLALSAFLRPRAGLIVRDPVTMEPLPSEGAVKPLTTYWRRRIKDGDVERAEEPPKSGRRKAQE